MSFRSALQLSASAATLMDATPISAATLIDVTPTKAPSSSEATATRTDTHATPILEATKISPATSTAIIPENMLPSELESALTVPGDSSLIGYVHMARQMLSYGWRKVGHVKKARTPWTQKPATPSDGLCRTRTVWMDTITKRPIMKIWDCVSPETNERVKVVVNMVLPKSDLSMPEDPDARHNYLKNALADNTKSYSFTLHFQNGVLSQVKWSNAKHPVRKIFLQGLTKGFGLRHFTLSRAVAPSATLGTILE